MCVLSYTPACLCGRYDAVVQKEKIQLAVEMRRPPPPQSQRYLCFSHLDCSVLLFLPARSPPLHQGRSSPGAEIQFRSYSSVFFGFTGPDSERALSYLLPAQIERLGASSSPCFHAVLSGRYSSVLRPAIGVYGWARCCTVSWRSLKLFIASVGSPNLLRRWNVFTRFLPNGARGPGITGRWLPLWCPILCFHS